MKKRSDKTTEGNSIFTKENIALFLSFVSICGTMYIGWMQFTQNKESDAINSERIQAQGIVETTEKTLQHWSSCCANSSAEIQCDVFKELTPTNCSEKVEAIDLSYRKILMAYAEDNYSEVRRIYDTEIENTVNPSTYIRAFATGLMTPGNAPWLVLMLVAVLGAAFYFAGRNRTGG